jgi:hypothetical protein
MPAQGPTATLLDDLQGTLERRINQRTFGRIHQLQVDVTPGRVAVRGYASSYYVKQLAIHAVLEALGGDRFPKVALEIEVASGRPAPGSPRDYQIAGTSDAAD